MIKYTKGQLREFAIKVFTTEGFECWRNNNIAVRGRKFIGRYGVSDTIGFGRSGGPFSGQFFACEIKAIGDELTYEQAQFLVDLNLSAGNGYVYEQLSTGEIKITRLFANPIPESKKRKK